MRESSSLTADALLDIIKREAARREGSSYHGKAPLASISSADFAAVFSPQYLIAKPLKHARDFLPLLGEEFIQEAFRTLLWRQADVAAREAYLGAIACGRASRWEILARIRFSPEGQKKSVRVRGLYVATAFSLAYRIPVFGPFLNGLVHLLALPMYLRDDRQHDARAFALLRALGR